MENIPTAKEFLKFKDAPNTGKFWEDILIEFAKLHVEQALKEASEEAESEEGAIIDLGFEKISASVNKKSILNSYPLENIE